MSDNAADNRRIALVTGASRGIGKAVAEALAARGWRVILAARSQKALEALYDQLTAAHGPGTAIGVPLDLKDFAAIDRLGATLWDRFKRLDGLAACAGVLGDLTPIYQAKGAMMEEAFAVNALANFRLIRSFHPLLRAATAARAVFVTSSRAGKAAPFWSAYGASKAALEQFVLTYANEIDFTDMKVNLFDPGPTRTMMRRRAFPGEDDSKLAAPDIAGAAIADMLAESETRHGQLVRLQS